MTMANLGFPLFKTVILFFKKLYHYFMTVQSCLPTYKLFLKVLAAKFPA